MYIKQYKKELKSIFNEKRHTGFEVEKFVNKKKVIINGKRNYHSYDF